MGDATGRITAIRVNEAQIKRLEAELDRLKHGQSTGTRLIGVGERVLVKLLVGMGMIMMMRYGMITNEELQAANVKAVEAEQTKEEALEIVDYAQAALETCE